MAVTHQKSRTKVSPRRKVAAKKVGSAKKPPNVKHTTSHTNPSAPKSKGSGRKTATHHPQNMVPVREYPGEGKNRHPFGKDVKVVG